jgi:IclR family acetate operon transcriptional repressor
MIGEVARGSSPVRQRAVPHLRRLLARFDETVSLAVRQQHDLVVVESLESTRPMRRAAVLGEREDWFASSLGKSLLSRLPENEANTILDCNPPQLHTVNSTVDRDAILTELRAIRVRGFAVDNEETRLGLTCIGVPITDATGRYTHALSASGPTVRINEQFDDIVVAMLGIAHHISQADCKE